MKRRWGLLVLIVGILLGSACSQQAEEKKDTVHLGINVEILEIDYENKTLHVVGLEESDKKIFGTVSTIDCTKALEENHIIQTKYGSNEMEVIDFEDLAISDRIAVNIAESEIEKLHDTGQGQVEQIQRLQ